MTLNWTYSTHAPAASLLLRGGMSQGTGKPGFRRGTVTIIAIDRPSCVNQNLYEGTGR